PPPVPEAAPDAVALARRHLDAWVDPDGRAVRRDTGGDTVSEGQVSALLLAVQSDDPQLAALVWEWTAAHLQRPDGLLASRWADGAVVDATPDAAADLAGAHALVAAGRRFADPALTAAGTRLARAVLDAGTTSTPLGRVLVGRPSGQVAPGAASPLAVEELAAAVPDPRWAELRTGSRAVLAALLAAATLPPDAARVLADGRVEALASPGAADVQFGSVAARVPVQFAASCDPADTALAAALAPALVRTDSQVRARYDLGGTPTVDYAQPASFVAAAAAAAAAGDDAARTRLLAAAARADARTPTSSGAAAVALGAALLDPRGTPLSPCRPPAPR
ncbi:hypothetical protein GTR02_03170, partial [Kineococcus sp. R8]|uniref:glycosyl hydrolase family 8 n=1 Tax=Kineococcus siccus TaxID=2696567 RepID=UPI0014132438